MKDGNKRKAFDEKNIKTKNKYNVEIEQTNMAWIEIIERKRDDRLIKTVSLFNIFQIIKP